jgi:putative heme-binding domain-containing protein
VGARGPSLRNRDFPAGYVRDTMLNGRSGTAMPAFKDALSGPEVALIAAYVMSLSPNNHQASAPDSVAVDPMQAAPLSDQAARGAALFFDTARAGGCSLCHGYAGKGGLLEPDLSTVARMTPDGIQESIVKPAASETGYAAITVVTKTGDRMTGVVQGRSDDKVSLFDVSSAPPVLRSFYAADGIKIEAYTGPALYKHDLALYSKREVVDLIAFLKSSDGAGK